MTARMAFQQVPALYLIQNQALYRKEKKAMMKQAGKIAALCLSLLLLLPTAASAEEGDAFSKSDYNNVAEEAEDAVITLEGDHGTLSDETRGRSGNPVVIERKGVYRITGRSDGVSIRIKEPKKSGNIYLILDHASMTNQKGPCIEAEAAEKVILQCVGENSLVSMSDSGSPLYSEDDLTVNTLGRNVANLTVGSIEFIESLYRSASAVCDPVVLEISQRDGIGSSLHSGGVGAGIEVIAQQLVRLTGLDRGLPQIRAIVVLQLAQERNGRVVHQELRVLPIRRFQRIDQADNLIHSDRVGSGGSHADRAAIGSENAGGLIGTSTDAEGLLLGDAEGAGKLCSDIAF